MFWLTLQVVVSLAVIFVVFAFLAVLLSPAPYAQQAKAEEWVKYEFPRIQERLRRAERELEEAERREKEDLLFMPIGQAWKQIKKESREAWDDLFSGKYDLFGRKRSY